MTAPNGLRDVPGSNATTDIAASPAAPAITSKFTTSATTTPAPGWNRTGTFACCAGCTTNWHEYEKSGRYGAFRSKGTLARATSAMISDVRAERTEAARTASPAPTPITVASRPATRTDSRRPWPTGRGRRRGKHSGAGPLLTVAAIVALILVVSKIDWSKPVPTEQQPAATATTTQAPVIVPPLPPPPETYVVQAGDTLENEFEELLLDGEAAHRLVVRYLAVPRMRTTWTPNQHH